MVTKRLLISLGLSLMLALGATSIAQETAPMDAAAASREKFRSLDEDVQSPERSMSHQVPASG